MKDQMLSVFFKDLSTMLVSGIALEQSLQTVSETAVDDTVRKMCVEALLRLDEGETFARSLTVLQVLPREAVLCIAAGETAGDLPMAFGMLAEYFAVKGAITQRVLSALGYPAVVILILAGVFFYMAVDVFPKAACLLPAEAGASSLTRGLLSFAGFIRSWGIFGAGAIVCCIIGIVYLTRFNPLSAARLCIRMPFIGRLMKDREMALGFFAVYVLFKSGMPLETAIREGAVVAGGITGERLRDCASYIVGGTAFSEAIRRDRYFPRFTADTIRVGEESGRYDEYLERLYRVFYKQLVDRLDLVAGAIRPFMLGVCGVFIALIAVGFLQPLYGNLTSIGAMQ